MANELVHGTQGTVLTQTEFEAVGLHVCNSQATGDLIYASSATQLTRLAIGSTGAVLAVSGGIPAWTLTPSGWTSITGAASTTSLIIQGALTQSTQRDIVFKTSNVADGSGSTRFTIGSNAATANAVFENCNVGIGATSPIDSLEILKAGNTRLVVRNSTETANNIGGLAFMTGSGARADTNVIADVYGEITQANPSTLKGDLVFTVNIGDNVNEVGRFTSARRLQLGVTSASTGILDLKGTTSGVVTVTVAAIAGTWTLTLPTTAGSAGQRLTTDGAGVCSWAA